MSNPRPPRGAAPPPRPPRPPQPTIPLRDLALDDRERAFYGPRTGDWLLLGLMVVILLGNGTYIWHQTGLSSQVGRAAFFGLLLLCVLWAALVYFFKLSVCVRVGPQGLSVVRGPWRTELNWREVARLTERTQMVQGQRYRWLVALARDGRKMQIRDDMVDDYARFRIEVYERFRLWRDHGGTWGTTGGGPYTARETLAGQTFWSAVGAITLALPAVYFLALLPETDPLGWALLLLAAVCAIISVRGMLRRATYTVDAKAIETRHKTGGLKLPWRDVAKVERTRHAFGGVIATSIRVGRFALKLAARTDGRVESFDWAPRVPEYLTLRGAGHQVRIRLHRLERPDELLAWVEFYERAARHLAQTAPPRKTGGPTRRLSPEPASDYADVGASGGRPPEFSDIAASGGRSEPKPPDLAGTTGPLDPWGEGREGEPDRYHAPPIFADQETGEDDWLRAQPRTRRSAAPAPAPTPAAEQPRREPVPPVPPHTSMSPLPPFTDHPPLNRPDQSLSGLDIFASAPEPEAIHPERAAPPQPVPPAYQSMPPERVRRTGPLDRQSGAAPYSPHYPQPPHAHAPDPYERQAPRITESWQPHGETPYWQPAPAGQPAQPAYPIYPEPEPAPADDGWFADEVEPGAVENAPTGALENLAESFAPWRDDANWQPPQLPRFGPPAPHPPREE